jgi:hypothetical protein
MYTNSSTLYNEQLAPLQGSGSCSCPRMIQTHYVSQGYAFALPVRGDGSIKIAVSHRYRDPSQSFPKHTPVRKTTNHPMEVVKNISLIEVRSMGKLNEAAV